MGSRFFLVVGVAENNNYAFHSEKRDAFVFHVYLDLRLTTMMVWYILLSFSRAGGVGFFPLDGIFSSGSV